MKRETRGEQRKGLLRDLIFFTIIVFIVLFLLLLFPEKRSLVLAASQEYFLEMITVLPAVMIIMALFAVFIPSDIVVKFLGKASGIKGILLSIFLGALPTGPLYIAFPMAATLINKGARISNIIIFLSSWACIKIPQELVELQFLGIQFMTLRLILTIIFVILMGFIIEKVIEKTQVKYGVEK